MTNLIQKLSKSLAADEHPSQAVVTALFQRYEEARKPRMKVAFDMSYQLTRLQTCDGWLNKIIMLYLIPILGFNFIADDLAAFCAGAPKLNYLPVHYNKPATVPWQDEEECLVADKAQSSSDGALAATSRTVELLADAAKLASRSAKVWYGAVFAALLTFVLFLSSAAKQRIYV